MKPLSLNNVLNALVLPVFLCIIMFLVWTIVLTVHESIHAGVLILVISIHAGILTWLYFAAADTFNLRYDDQFLYLSSVTRTMQIPLVAVQKVQKATDGIQVKGLTSWKYTVTLDPMLKLGEQTVYEIIGTGKIEAFVDTVKKVNPGVKN